MDPRKRVVGAVEQKGLSVRDAAIMLVGVALLAWRRIPVWLIVMLSAGALV